MLRCCLFNFAALGGGGGGVGMLSTAFVVMPTHPRSLVFCGLLWFVFGTAFVHFSV